MKRFISTLSSLVLAATSLFAAFPATTASAASVKADVIYDLVSKTEGLTSTLEGDSNVVKVPADMLGKEVSCSWTITNGTGIAGVQYSFDLEHDGFKYVESSFKAGRALKSPTINDKNHNSVEYVYASKDETDIADGGVLANFTITLPTTLPEGGVTIGRKPNAIGEQTINKAGTELPYSFRNLVFVAADDTTTASSSGTTTTTASTTTTTGTTGTTPDISNADIIYDLIAKSEGLTSTLEGGVNVVKVPKDLLGSEVSCSWTITGGTGVAGVQYSLDLQDGGVTYVADSFKAGRALKSPTLNDANPDKVEYVYASKDETDIADGGILANFTVKLPTELSAEGATLNVADAIGNQTINKANKEYSYAFRALKFVNADEDTTTASTASSSTTTTTSTSTPSGDPIIYDILSKTDGLASTLDGDYNVVEVPADKLGSQLDLTWTVTNGKSIAGIDYTFDLAHDGVAYVAGSLKGARTFASPTLNDKDGSKVQFVYASKDEKDAADGSVVATFSVTLPTEIPADGIIIGVKADAENNMTVNKLNDELSYTWRNLKIVAASSDTTTTSTTASSTTTTTTTSNIPGGEVSWKLDEVTAKPGDTGVKVPVLVEKAGDLSGFIARFTYDEGVTFKGIEGGDALTGEYTVNNDKLVAVFADENGADQTAAVGKTVVNLLFDVPTGASGRYNVKFVSVEAVNTTESPVTVTTADGAIIVSDLTPVAGGAWDIDEVAAKAGEAGVKVPVLVKESGDLSGYIARFTYDERLTFKGIEGGDALTGDATFNSDKQVVVWADENGADQTAKLNGTVVNLIFDVPADAKNGDIFPVNFSYVDAVNTDQAPVIIETEDGDIHITDKEVKPGGSTTWDIEEVESAAGATSVKVPVDVTAAGELAGYIARFTYDERLEFVGIENGDALTGDPTFNNDKQVVVWADENGADQNAAEGKVVVNLIFNVPADAQPGDVFPVKFVSVEAVNTDESTVTVSTADGDIHIPDESTTTTTTTTSEDTTTSTTTTTTASEDTTTSTTTSTTASDDTTTTTTTSTTTSTTTTSTDSDDTTTSTTTSTTLAPGSVGWTIDTVNAAPGEEGVKVKVTINGDPGTAGFFVRFNPDAALTQFGGFTWGDSYTDDPTLNPDKYVAIWAADNAVNQKAAEGSTVLTLTFTAPDAEGVYPITFANLEVVDENGNPLTLSQTNGAIIVSATTTSTTTTTTVSSTTTTSTTDSADTTTSTTTSATGSSTTTSTTTSATGSSTTTSTTTSATGSSTTTSTTTSTTASEDTTTSSTTTTTEPEPGKLMFQVDKVTGAPGETVDVPVKVFFDDGTAGIRMQFVLPEGASIEGFTWGDAYANPEEAEWNGTDYVLVWADPNGANQTAADGATVLTLKVKIPDDAAIGQVYPINFVAANTDATTTNNKAHELILTDGSVTVVDEKDVALFRIDNVTGEPGEVVDIPITLKSDQPVTSFSVTLDVPDDFQLGDFVPSDVLKDNGTFTWDPTTKTLTWTANDGASITPDGSPIGYVKGTIPEGAQPGDQYAIKITDASAKSADGKDLTPAASDGTVTVIEKQTTPTSTTSTTSTTTTTTTTSTTDSEGTTTSTTTSATGSDDTTTSTTTTTESDTTSSTTTTSTTASDDTSTSTTTTTTLEPGQTGVVTSYSIEAVLPTRVNYWSHDKRTFRESAGIRESWGIANGYASFKITVDKYYVDDKGEKISATPFETKTLDATPYCDPAESENTPNKIWTNEIIAQYGENFTPEQDLAATHKNTYPVKFYYYGSEVEDPDFKINGDQPLDLGTVNIYIGVKGDITLNNHVEIADAILVLQYYNFQIMDDVYPLNDDPALDGPDGLCFFLGNVCYHVDADPTSALWDPQQLNIADSIAILTYYNLKYVAGFDETDWGDEDVCNYDLLDTFHGEALP